MSAAAPMAAPPPPLDSVLSFGDAATEDEARRPALDARAFSDAAGSEASDEDEDEEFAFEFAFAPPLAPGGALALAPADDLFSHGRIVPAYPVFDRHLLDDVPASPRPSTSTSSPPPPSADTYCNWAPRSAPGSPSRAAAAFPKSASAGEARRHHHWRLRDLVALGGGRSRSDGKEKFVFLQPAAADKPLAAPPQKQSKKKGGKVKAAAAATEMDMATAHRLFYGGKQQQGAGDRRQQQQQSSYLPYRPAIVGFFATAHALGRSHHPY